MSAPEGIALASCRLDVVELAAFPGRAPEAERLAAERGILLPKRGGFVTGGGVAVLSVRPERWLLLGPRLAPGESAAFWQGLSGAAAVLDQSAALVGFLLAGPALGDVLARGCRLDLAADKFPAGCAAATIMAQVQVILARLTRGMLLLTPATTGRHLREWLVTTSQPFGFTPVTDVGMSELESST